MLFVSPTHSQNTCSKSLLGHWSFTNTSACISDVRQSCTHCSVLTPRLRPTQSEIQTGTERPIQQSLGCEDGETERFDETERLTTPEFAWDVLRLDCFVGWTRERCPSERFVAGRPAHAKTRAYAHPLHTSSCRSSPRSAVLEEVESSDRGCRKTLSGIP